MEHFITFTTYTNIELFTYYKYLVSKPYIGQKACPSHVKQTVDLQKKIDNGRFPELRAFRLTSAEELVWIYLWRQRNLERYRHHGAFILSRTGTEIGTGTRIRTMGDNRSYSPCWFRCNLKVSKQFHTTHFPDPCPGLSSSQCEYAISSWLGILRLMTVTYSHVCK